MLKENDGIALWNSDNRKAAMKKLIIAISMFPICVSLAQTNWAFQWHGQERGIIFGQTNLSKSVKAAIRDDIALVMSHIAVAGTEIHPIQPDDPDHGKIGGLMNIRADGDTYPDDFPIGDFRMVNGVPFFLLSEEDCATYVTAITLTNSAKAKISALPAILVPFTNGFNIAKMTMRQKRDVIWHPSLQEDNDPAFKELFDESMPQTPGLLRFFPRSVLSYKMQELEEGKGLVLTCTVSGKSFFEGNPKGESTLFVHIKGRWRFCPPIM
jgi:hypothetical protein